MVRAPEQDDIDFEPEDELGGEGAAKAKMRKLRDELEKTKIERQEFLDGWQRCKADAANAARERDERLRSAAALGKRQLAEDLLPVLDSFDVAMQGGAWNSLDSNWRTGIEHVHATFLRVLEESGIRALGEPGEPFDHARHEAVGEEDGEEGVILRVVRRGYASGGSVIRPASVIVGKSP